VFFFVVSPLSLQPLSRNLKANFIEKAMPNSITGKIAAVVIVVMKDEPISLYHSKLRSLYIPLKGRKPSPASSVLALVRIRRIAVLKN